MPDIFSSKPNQNIFTEDESPVSHVELDTYKTFIGGSAVPKIDRELEDRGVQAEEEGTIDSDIIEGDVFVDGGVGEITLDNFQEGDVIT